MYSQLLHWPAWASLSLFLVVRPGFAVTDSYNGQYADDCPELCSRAGSSASNWTHIHSVKELSSCNQTILFNLNVQKLIDDPQSIITIQGCTVATGGGTAQADDAGRPNLALRQLEAHADGGAAADAEPPSCGGAKTETLSAKPSLGGQSSHAKQGDSCAALADRCGISGNDITKYNTRSDFCSTLKARQYYCCGSGDLPDMRPQPDADGTCHVYPVAANDGCWAIADSFGISQDDIDSFNKKTWGWAGCGSLQLGQRICVSKGNPPMPAPVTGTACGPQVPGTKKPTDGTDFADLNPCPLNACCDVWGFCGTTTEFCTKTPADNGGPGTTQPGKSSCISNCGMDIVNNGQGPSSFEKLGYFEAFNEERKCLHMDASNIPTDKYTSIHFAFAGVTASFDVELGTVNGQFERFKGLKGPKKILSFGGWAFSTDQATFQRFRQATNPPTEEHLSTA